MKRYAVIIYTIILIGAFLVPLYAKGPQNDDNHNNQTNVCPRFERGDTNLTDDQRQQLKELRQNFLENTEKTRQQIQSKKTELKALLSTASPDESKLKDLQKEISNLRAELDQARIDQALKIKKIIPEANVCQEMGMGFRHHRHNMGPDDKELEM